MKPRAASWPKPTLPNRRDTHTAKNAVCVSLNPWQPSGENDALLYHSRITALFAFTLLLPYSCPPAAPFLAAPGTAQKDRLARNTLLLPYPCITIPCRQRRDVTVSPVRIYTIRQASTATRTSPPPFHERYLGSPSNRLTNALPGVQGGSLNSLPGAHGHFRDHGSMPHSIPYGVIAENRQQQAIAPDDSDACFPLRSENNPRTIRTHLSHSIQIKSTDFSNFS